MDEKGPIVGRQLSLKVGSGRAEFTVLAAALSSSGFWRFWKPC